MILLSRLFFDKSYYRVYGLVSFGGGYDVASSKLLVEKGCKSSTLMILEYYVLGRNADGQRVGITLDREFEH